MSWLIKRLPKKRWKRVCIYLFSIFAILLAGDMILVQYWRHIDIGTDTTRITSPLNADGMPNYIAARNVQCAQGVTAQNNSAPDFLRIIGTVDFPEAWRNDVLPEIGLPATSSPALLMGYDAWIRVRNPATTTNENTTTQPETDDPTKAPWKSADHPVRVQWLRAQDKALTRLHQALEKERFYIPWATTTGTAFTGETISVLLPWVGKIRECSRLLMSDAMRAIGDQDFPAFDRDIVDISKLARRTEEGSTLVEYLVACASEMEACRAIEVAATTPGFLRANDVLSLQNNLTDLTAFPDPSRVLDQGERYFLLDALCYASAYGFDRLMQRGLAGDDDSVHSHPLARLFGPVHYNAGLRRGNLLYDQLVTACKLPAFKQRQQAFEDLTESSKKNANVLSFSEMLAINAIPSFGPTFRYHTETLTQRSLAELALALNAYRGAHGEYPANLAALSPPILPRLPSDQFADAPFHYREEGKGYILYSVGPDGEDNGGIDRKNAKGGKYDIVVKAAE